MLLGTGLEEDLWVFFIKIPKVTFAWSSLVDNSPSSPYRPHLNPFYNFAEKLRSVSQFHKLNSIKKQIVPGAVMSPLMAVIVCITADIRHYGAPAALKSLRKCPILRIDSAPLFGLNPIHQGRAARAPAHLSARRDSL